MADPVLVFSFAVSLIASATTFVKIAIAIAIATGVDVDARLLATAILIAMGHRRRQHYAIAMLEEVRLGPSALPFLRMCGLKHVESNVELHVGVLYRAKPTFRK